MDILENLLAVLRKTCASFPDKRSGEGSSRFTMADIGLSAFSLFFMQSESFLSYQRALEEGHHTSNCQTLFGMERIPTDNHIRNMLDPVNPTHLQPCFDQMTAVLQAQDSVPSFQVLGKRMLIALDGTEYFCSQKLGCSQCLKRERNNGKTEHYHTMPAATLAAPGHNQAIPLMPEFIAPQDGQVKQDCERNAAKRWLAVHASRVQDLSPIYLGDDLFACQSIVGAIQEKGADFLLVCKPDSHKALYDFIDGAPLKSCTTAERHKGKRLNYRYQWIEAVPLRDSQDAVNVNWFSVEITDANGKITCRSAFVTSLAITSNNVVELAACARARWKIENGSFNVMKNNSYRLEHNFGHGKQFLAMIFAAMNLLAFAFHTLCDCLDAQWQKARNAKGSRQRFFQHLHTLTAYLIFPSWHIFLETLITSKPPPDIINTVHS